MPEQVELMQTLADAASRLAISLAA